MLRRLCPIPLFALLLVLTIPAGALENADPVIPDPALDAEVAKLTDLQERIDHDQAWIAAVEARMWHDAVTAALAAHERQVSARRPPQSPHRAAPATASGACGGDLPPCYVMERESGGSLTAENPVSTASGKWQFLDSTWAGAGGYAHASDAPEEVQDDRARELWAGGDGCSHWSAC